MSQKGFTATLILIGVLLVTGILAGGVYYIGTLKSKPQTQNPVVTSQTPQSATTSSSTSTDEIVNWKTYTNNSGEIGNIGFSIKYPSSYKIISAQQIIDRDNPQIGIPYNFLKITREEKTNDFVLVVSVKDVSDLLMSKSISYTDKNINGLVFKQYTNDNKFVEIGNCDAFGYVIEKNNSIYNLYTCNTDTSIFDKMISTFKFLDQNQASNQIYLYLARKSVFLYNTENIGAQGTEKTGGAPANIVIPLPSAAVVKTLINQGRQQKSSVTIDGSEFWVNVFGNPNEGCVPSCEGTDSAFDVNGVHVGTLRIWKDSRGVIDINPQTVILNNYSIPYFTIHKNKPNDVFTDSEVNLWINLLGKMKTIPVN